MFTTETLVAHRAQKLSALLPVVLMFALAETEPQGEPLKVRMLYSDPNRQRLDHCALEL